MNNLKLFTIARTALGITVPQFAASLGYTPSYIYLVLKGKRKSERVSQEIDALVKRGLTQLKVNPNFHNAA